MSPDHLSGVSACSVGPTPSFICTGRPQASFICTAGLPVKLSEARHRLLAQSLTSWVTCDEFLPSLSLGFLVHNPEPSIQLPEFLQNLLKTTQTSSKRWKASAPFLPLPTLRQALLTLPLVLDHGTMHLGQEPIFHSDMYFLHVIPNERRITRVCFIKCCPHKSVGLCKLQRLSTGRYLRIPRKSQFPFAAKPVDFLCLD